MTLSRSRNCGPRQLSVTAETLRARAYTVARVLVRASIAVDQNPMAICFKKDFCSLESTNVRMCGFKDDVQSLDKQLSIAYH